MAYQDARRLGMWAYQPIESGDMRDHQHWYVENRDRVCCAQLPCQRRKSDLDGMVIVEEEVGCSNEIEGHYEQPKERTYPHGEQGQDGQYSGYKVAISCERGEASGQAKTDDAWKNKNKPEEAKAMDSSDDTLRFKPFHRPKPGQNIHAEAEQARDIA